MDNYLERVDQMQINIKKVKDKMRGVLHGQFIIK